MKNLIIVCGAFILGFFSAVLNAAPTDPCTMLSWGLITTDTLGNPITHDNGWIIYEQQTDGSFVPVVTLSNQPFTQQYPITGIFSDGQHTLAITATMQDGRESTYSNTVTFNQIGGVIWPDGIPASPGGFRLECTVVIP